MDHSTPGFPVILYGQIVLEKCAKSFSEAQWKKNSIQQIVLEKLDIYMQKNEFGALFYTICKN